MSVMAGMTELIGVRGIGIHSIATRKKPAMSVPWCEALQPVDEEKRFASRGAGFPWLSNSMTDLHSLPSIASSCAVIAAYLGESWGTRPAKQSYPRHCFCSCSGPGLWHGWTHTYTRCRASPPPVRPAQVGEVQIKFSYAMLRATRPLPRHGV
ncbi:hypothetical protein LX32DRAFT_340897 [Colletotrichum zoysiae]|uniref:Uncharacterized protein n=1 Tax=Colletotrichum zoysiae TaxID=1216348 RepID=A0AAD9HTP8_9PEZI|nr:hypothetical protein LX32DRAFT_340897 [Colletotrichum zoysiae]